MSLQGQVVCHLCLTLILSYQDSCDKFTNSSGGLILNLLTLADNLDQRDELTRQKDRFLFPSVFSWEGMIQLDKTVEVKPDSSLFFSGQV